MPSTESHSTKRTSAAAPEEARSGGAGAPPDRASFLSELGDRVLGPRLREVLPQWQLPPRKGIVAASGGVLVGICAILAGATAFPPRDLAGFDLPAGNPGSNVGVSDPTPIGPKPGAKEPDKPAANAGLSGPVKPKEPPGVGEPERVAEPTKAQRRTEPPPGRGPALGSDWSGNWTPPGIAPPPTTPAHTPVPEVRTVPAAPLPTIGPPVRPIGALPVERPLRDWQHGASTMPHLKTLGLPVILAAALTARPAVAADTNSDGNKVKIPTPPAAEQANLSLKDLLKALDERLKPLTDDLQKANTKLDSQPGLVRDQVKAQLDQQIKGVAERLQKIETATGGLQTLGKDLEVLRQSSTENRMDLEQIKGRLGKLETALSDQLGQNMDLVAQLNNLRNKLDDAEKRIREARIVPQPAAPATPTPTQGFVVLRNTYNTDVSIRVNGRVLRVGPGQTISADPQPAGTVTYEVLGIKGPDTVALAPGQTVTITVYPLLP